MENATENFESGLKPCAETVLITSVSCKKTSWEGSDYSRSAAFGQPDTPPQNAAQSVVALQMAAACLCTLWNLLQPGGSLGHQNRHLVSGPRQPLVRIKHRVWSQPLGYSCCCCWVIRMWQTTIKSNVLMLGMCLRSTVHSQVQVKFPTVKLDGYFGQHLDWM